MKIIIENGGSKLDWLIVGEDIVRSGVGINFFAPDKEISTQIEKTFHSLFSSKNDIEIDFYTAGVSDYYREKIKKKFSHFSTIQSINIFSDMLAASRALFKYDSGISCILGTGSNCAYFDGNINHEIVFSTGYLLGDEGSGYDLGRRFLQLYFQKKIPLELKSIFEQKNNMNRKDLLTDIYRAKNKKFYIANFSKFLKQHENHPFVSNIINDSFLSFLKKNPFQYKGFNEKKFGFVGSIAFNFSHHLKNIMKQYDCDLVILEKPIEYLKNYYLD